MWTKNEAASLWKVVKFIREVLQMDIDYDII